MINLKKVLVKLEQKKFGVDLFVLLLSAFVFLRRIDAFPLRNWDEAWYAEIIKNMAGGKFGFLMPYWNGRVFYDNEPLYFWLSTPIVKVFGLGEWQVRIVSVLSAIFAAYLVYLIGQKLVNKTVGIFGFLIFLTIGGLVIRFAHGNLDALLVCLFLATFYFYTKAGKFAFNILTGISFGFGLLVKSWGIGLFPLFLILLYCMYLRKIEIRKLAIMVFVGLLVFLPWYVWGIVKFGDQFIAWYVLNPSEGRLATPLANFSFDYFFFIFRDLGFWLLLPAGFLVFEFKKISKFRNTFLVPFLFAAIAYVTFLNFLGDKSDWYLIPSFPLLAIGLGFITSELFKKRGWAVIGVFVVILMIQYLNVLRTENITPDRSIVGANLGVGAARIIPYGDQIILYDPDFTSFLYYSGQDHVYTLQNDRKPGEWWILKPEELGEFLGKNNNSWIVTRDKNIQGNKFETADYFNGYYFIKSL